MDFDQIIDRSETESIKWNYFPKDVLPMWVADMDFASPPAVIRALHERVDHGIFGYGFTPNGLDDLIIERLRRLYSWEVGQKQIEYVPGVVTGFNLVIRAVCQPGEAIIIQTPAYPPMIYAPEDAGLRRVENPLQRNADGSYSIDFDLFEKQIVEERVRVFLLCNPQNPTGRVFTRNELLNLAEICLRHRVLICSDEIHCDFIYDGREHFPIASLSPEISEITMTFMAPSKTYNIAGLHASVAIIQNQALREKFSRTRHGIVGYPGVLAMSAAKAAYEFGDEWLRDLLFYLQANRDYLDQTLKRDLPELKMAKPEGTFLAWLDCHELKVEGSYQNFFAEKARVGLNDGTEFGGPGKGFVRLNFGTPRANLVEALHRISQALHG